MLGRRLTAHGDTRFDTGLVSEGSSPSTAAKLGEEMPTKQTPKSCSCSQCRRGKHTRSGRALIRYDERKFRHGCKIALKKGAEEIGIVPIGNYYD